MNVPIRPEASVDIAWGLTHLQSENEEAKIYGQYIRDYLENLRKELKEPDNIKKDEAEKIPDAPDEKNIRYFDNLLVAIDSCVRTLGIIIRGRNLNFEENDKLRGKKIEEINALSKSILSLQGILPRVQATTIGGVSVLVILKGLIEPIFPKFPEISIEYFILFCLGIGYVFAELLILPYYRKMVTNEMIRNDRDRDIYFHNYIKLSRIVLKRLLREAIDIYNKIYNEKYPEINEKRMDEILDKFLPYPIACPNMSKCKVGEEITDKNWVLCETVDYKKCNFFKEKTV